MCTHACCVLYKHSNVDKCHWSVVNVHVQSKYKRFSGQISCATCKLHMSKLLNIRLHACHSRVTQQIYRVTRMLHVRFEHICRATCELHVSTEQICWATCKFYASTWSNGLLKCATRDERITLRVKCMWGHGTSELGFNYVTPRSVLTLLTIASASHLPVSFRLLFKS